MEYGENVNTDSELTLESSEADIETCNEHYFDFCEHKSQTKGGLEIHIGRKHKDIHQLDVQVQTEREPDDFWGKN